MFSSWTVGNKLVLVRNKNYWGKRAHLDRVIFRPIADNTARLQALQSGEVQGYDLVDPNDIKTIQSNKSLKLLNRPAFNVGYVGINQAHAPLNNIKVRQAIAYGLNRAAVVKGFYAGRGVVANQFLPDQVVGFATKGVPSYPFNPAKAKALLKAAGVSMPCRSRSGTRRTCRGRTCRTRRRTRSPSVRAWSSPASRSRSSPSRGGRTT